MDRCDKGLGFGVLVLLFRNGGSGARSREFGGAPPEPLDCSQNYGPFFGYLIQQQSQKGPLCGVVAISQASSRRRQAFAVERLIGPLELLGGGGLGFRV